MRRLLSVILLIPAGALAASGGGEAIVMVADSRRFTGWQAWWVNLYNESHWYFALTTILVIPCLGVLFGSATAFLMSRLGIDLKSRTLAEH